MPWEVTVKISGLWDHQEPRYGRFCVELLSHFTGINFEAVEYDNGYVAGFQCEQELPSDFNPKYSQYLKPVPIDDQCWIIYG